MANEREHDPSELSDDALDSVAGGKPVRYTLPYEPILEPVEPIIEPIVEPILLPGEDFGTTA